MGVGEGMATKNAWKEQYGAVANNGKLRQRFSPGVPRKFDQDCSLFKKLAADLIFFMCMIIEKKEIGHNMRLGV